MPVQPSKLKSYMEQVAEDQAYPDYGDDENELHEYKEEAEEELEEAGASGDYEGFLELLFAHAEEIQAAASSVIVDAMDSIDEESKAAIAAAMATMPQELVDGIKAHLADMDPDQLHELVENLEEAGVIENDASVVPFLYWAARSA